VECSANAGIILGYWVSGVTTNQLSFARITDTQDGTEWYGNGTDVIELSAGDYIEFTVYVTSATRSLRQDRSYGYITLLQAANASLMFDLLHSKKPTADTPDDEFDSTTLDGKWTAVSGSSGTVDLLETGNVEKYDLATRPGWLLLQVGSAGAQQVALRQDFTLPDGASIVMAIAPNVGVDGNTGVIAQDRLVVTVNDSDTTSRTGTFLELNLDSNTDQFGVSAWDGTNSESTHVAGSGIGQTDVIFLRIARSGTTYYPFYSTSGGGAWVPLSDGHALGSAMDNVWIGFENYAAHDALTPIAAVAWVRQGTNALDPWNPNAAVAVANETTYYAKVEMTSGFSITNDSFVSLSWDAVVTDPLSMWAGGNPKRLTVPIGGLYLARLHWAMSSGTHVAVFGVINKNSETPTTAGVADQSQAASSYTDRGISSGIVSLDSGDYVAAGFYQDGSSAQDLILGETYFELLRLGPLP